MADPKLPKTVKRSSDLPLSKDERVFHVAALVLPAIMTPDVAKYPMMVTNQIALSLKMANELVTLWEGLSEK